MSEWVNVWMSKWVKVTSSSKCYFSKKKKLLVLLYFEGDERENIPGFESRYFIDIYRI